jgi:hypothetical protein
MTPAQMIEKYILLRNKSAEIKGRHVKELTPYIDAMLRLENELLRHLNDTKLDSINGPKGTAFKQSATTVSVEDWTKALDYIRDSRQWDLLEARVAKNAALSVIEETKKPIPGVKISQAVVLRVRAS